LLIGIAPGADFEPTANPAQALGRIRRANGAANAALGRPLGLIRHNGSLGFIEQLLIDYSFWNGRGCWLAFHQLKLQ
jgi:hypothetical protein